MKRMPHLTSSESLHDSTIASTTSIRRNIILLASGLVLGASAWFGDIGTRTQEVIGADIDTLAIGFSFQW